MYFTADRGFRNIMTMNGAGEKARRSDFSINKTGMLDYAVS
jgi:hypothetical protein